MVKGLVNTSTSWLFPTAALFAGIFLSGPLNSVYSGTKTSLTGAISAVSHPFTSPSGLPSSENFTLPSSYSCDLNYTVELLSFDPLVLYVNSFMSEDEVNHVLEVRWVFYWTCLPRLY